MRSGCPSVQTDQDGARVAQRLFSGRLDEHVARLGQDVLLHGAIAIEFVPGEPRKVGRVPLVADSVLDGQERHLPSADRSVELHAPFGRLDRRGLVAEVAERVQVGPAQVDVD